SASDNDVHLEPRQFGGKLGPPLGPALRPPILDCDGAPVDPAVFMQPLQKNSSPGSPGGLGRRSQVSDGRKLRRLLRPCRERPSRRAAEQRDELPSPHSITSSAVPSSVAGTSSPRTLAVCRLMTNSNFAARITGRSPGFSPLRIRPA